MLQQQQGWGAKVIERLARDLKQAFPEMKGFSAHNLKYMRAFAEAYPDEQIVQQLVAQIPWGYTETLIASGDIDKSMGGEIPPSKSGRGKRKPKERSLESPAISGTPD
nr:DUF1016 N-terminal domain-containing protein [Nostoc punctiforme]